MKNSNYIKRLVLLSIITIACFYPVKIYAQQAGTLDSTFGNNGLVYVDSNLQYVPYVDAQNRFVSLFRKDDSTIVLYRHLIDGSIDNTFGNNGQMFLHCDSAEIYLLQIQDDNKILCAGIIPQAPDSNGNSPTDFYIARFLPNGSIDSLFGNHGSVIIDLGQYEYVGGITVNVDSTILFSGSTETFWIGSDVVLFRLLYNGAIDSTFGINGKVITDLTPSGYDRDGGGKMIVQPDGKILMLAASGSWFAYSGTFAMVRYEPEGTLDTSFANDGIYLDTITYVIGSDIALEDDLSILVAGSGGSAFGGGFYSVLNKFTTNGEIDTAFAVNGSYESFWNPYIPSNITSINIQSDHKIVVTGTLNDSLLLMRFTQQGEPDNTFAQQGRALYQFDGLICSGNLACLFPNDKITVVGHATNQVDTNKVFIARFNNDIFNALPSEPNSGNDFLIYPNPAKELLVISFPLLVDKKVTINITDITGKIIYNTTTINSEKEEVNTSAFAEGVYLVRVQTTDFIETKKVIISK